jgi:hypothetical protein
VITAVDSSVLLDVLTEDPRFVVGSETALRRARLEGSLIVCECVIAEVYPALDDAGAFGEFCDDLEIEFIPMSKESAFLAGQYFCQYLKRGGKKSRVVADFMIGAHATCQADRLLARDRGYFKSYFRDLHLWDPAAPPKNP